MEKKDLRDLSSSLRSLYNKGMESARKHNIDYAIEQLKQVVKKYPSFMDGRKQLRTAEKRKCQTTGAIGKFIAKLKSFLIAAKIKPLVKKKPLQAMAACEDALAVYLYNPVILTLLAEAAVAAKAPYIAIDELEFVRSFCPKKEANLRRLAKLYEQVGDGIKHLATMQQVAALHPNSLAMDAEMRSAAALASLQSEWGNEEQVEEKRVEKASADVGDKVLRAEDDIVKQIKVYEKELSAQESIDMRRKLAGLYHRVKRFDDAIKAYQQIMSKLDTFDPAMDALIEKSQLAKYDEAIKVLEESDQPDKDSSIEEIRKKRYQYRLDRSTDRVQRFPNDTQLRYELAVVYFEGGFIDNALEQFQYARRNPQRRVSCMMYLGKCFQAKGQFDMAIEQLDAAVSEMQVMDKEKMQAMYYLAEIYEASDNKEKALELFKEIYRVDVNFMDVSKRMEAFYKK